MPRLTAREMKENRDYIAAHEDKLRNKLANGATYEQLSYELGIGIGVLKRMLETVLPERNVRVHPACTCQNREARQVPVMGTAVPGTNPQRPTRRVGRPV